MGRSHGVAQSWTRLNTHTGRPLPSKKRKPPPGLGTALLCHASHSNNTFVSCYLIFFLLFLNCNEKKKNEKEPHSRWLQRHKVTFHPAHRGEYRGQDRQRSPNPGGKHAGTPGVNKASQHPRPHPNPTLRLDTRGTSDDKQDQTELSGPTHSSGEKTPDQRGSSGPKC